MVGWDSIGAVAGIIGSVVATGSLVVAYRLLPRQEKPKENPRIIQFDWDDIPQEGKVHRCAYIRNDGRCFHTQYSTGLSPHATESECWAKELSFVFSGAWEKAMRSGPRKVTRPTFLPSGRNYIYTDVQTIKAFILCSIGTASNPEWQGSGSTWSSDGIRTQRIQVLVRQITCPDTGETAVVAHIHGCLKENLTKRDVEGVLSGYLPWYREEVRLPNGERVSAPTKGPADVARAGWLLAIGLSGVEPLEAAPRARHITEKPINRLYDILADKIYTAFPNDRNVYTVLMAVWKMITELTESGVFIAIYDSNGCITDEDDELKKISGPDATFIMNIFNTPPNVVLKGSEKTRLEPILIPLLHAAFRGVHTVVKAFKNSLDHGKLMENLGQDYREQHWHELLRNPLQTVYLEDCAHRSE